MSVRKITAAAVLDIADKVRQLQSVPDSPKFESHAYCVGYAINCVIRASAKSKNPKIKAHRATAKAAYYDYKNHGVLPRVEDHRKLAYKYDPSCIIIDEDNTQTDREALWMRDMLHTLISSGHLAVPIEGFPRIDEDYEVEYEPA